MIQVLIVTHSEMAQGIKKTAEFIMGPQENLHAITAYIPGHEQYLQEVSQFLGQNTGDDVVIFTDIIGGSVNTEITQLTKKFSNLHIISGVNLPMVIQLLLTHEPTLDQTIIKTLKEGKAGIQNVNETLGNSQNDFDDF